jgi:membrane protease YdiL (CAAX protease family)
MTAEPVDGYSEGNRHEGNRNEGNKRGENMKAQSNTLIKVLVSATLVIIPLVAAAWLIPAGFPMLWRQVILTSWGVGAMLAAERLLFSPTLGEAVTALGFVPARMRTVLVSLLVAVPMWMFLPLYAWFSGVEVTLKPEWFSLLIGIVLVNGITEEVIHRAFVFGHLRRERSFARAATISATVFAIQHLYLIWSVGMEAGLASVALAVLLAFPLAFLFEQGGNSLGGPAIIHTSTNAPVLIFALPQSFMAPALIPHMVVLVISLYLVFFFRGFLSKQPQPVVEQHMQMG